MGGWIKIHRGIASHWIWSDPLKLKWWLDILITANHAPVKVNIGMQLYECGRGQSVMSLSAWAKRWKVSKDKARNFLSLLEKDNMIKLESLKVTTRITICNYDSYQDWSHGSQTQPKRNANDNQTPSHPNKNEENITPTYVGAREELNLEQCYNILSTSRMWFEQFCMNNKITPTIFYAKLHEFFKELENRGETTKSEADAKHHFASWYKQNKNKEVKNEDRQSSREAKARNHYAEYEAIRNGQRPYGCDAVLPDL